MRIKTTVGIHHYMKQSNVNEEWVNKQDLLEWIKKQKEIAKNNDVVLATLSLLALELIRE